MTESATELATVDLDMLDRAESESGGSASVMSGIINLKIYNPKIGEDAEANKSNKFKVTEPGKMEPIFEEGPFTFNPLDIAYAYSGAVYPIMENGTYASDKVFFSTSEFGKFAKKTDVI